MSKLASMETELAPLRAQARQQPTGPTPQQVIQAMIQDPLGTMNQFKVPQEYRQHMTAALVAGEMQAMGIAVDPGLQARVQQFPQTQKIDNIQTELEALRQREKAREDAAKASVVRESLKTTAADKTKYPHLAAAMANNPELYASRVSAESDPAALAESLEKELAATAAALGYKPPQAQTASQADAGNANTTTSTQVTAQTVNTRAGDPPPLPNKTASSGFSEADDAALKERIARKHAAGAYGKTSPQ